MKKVKVVFLAKITLRRKLQNYDPVSLVTLPSYARLELEDFTKVPFKYPEGLVWCGTSISDQSLNEAECNKQTRFKVKKLKAYTLNAKEAKYKPNINVEAVLRDAFQNNEGLLVIEVGINEITDENGQNEQMRQEKIQQKCLSWWSLLSGQRRRIACRKWFFSTEFLAVTVMKKPLFQDTQTKRCEKH